MQNTTSSRHWRTGWNGASRPGPSSLPSTKTTLLGPTWPGRGHFAHTQVSPSTSAAGALMMRRSLSVRRRRNKERDEYETESYRGYLNCRYSAYVLTGRDPITGAAARWRRNPVWSAAKIVAARRAEVRGDPRIPDSRI